MFKNKIFLTMISIFLLFNIYSTKGYGAEGEYTFDLVVPAASIQTIKTQDNNSYLLYSFANNLFTSEVGRPKLPVLIKRVALPPEAQKAELEVLQSNSNLEPLIYPVYPVPKPVVKKDSSGARYVEEEFSIDKNFYKHKKDPYPQTKAAIKEIANFRGLTYAVIEVYPFQYIPKDNLLNEDREITLRITWSKSAKKITHKLNKEDKAVRRAIKGLNLVNQEEFLSENNLEQIEEAKTALLPETAGTVNRPIDLLTGVHTDYLIITANAFYDDLNSSLNTLASHRASVEGGGYDVAIVKTSDIYATAFPDKTGSESNDQLIKMFIKYAYGNWNGINPPLQFVLLAGDADGTDANLILPLHISSIMTFQGGDENIATDFWYACVDGNYPDYLNDTSDQIGDISIGRFAVKTEDELQKIVNKTIGFETVFPMIPGDWRSQADLLSGFQSNSGIYLEETTSFFSTLHDNYLIPNYMETLEAFRSDLDPGDSGRIAFKEKIISDFNNGRLIMQVSAHGSKITWSDGTAYQNIFHSDDVSTRLTNSDKLPLVFSLACDTGWFDDPAFESLGEAFVEKTNTGAVLFLGSSRAVSISSYSLMENIFKEILENNNKIVGNTILTAKNNSRIEYRLIYNILGDPALNISQILLTSQKPDLTCSLTSYQLSGSDVTFHAKIKNTGLSDAGNIPLGLYDGDPKLGGTAIPATINPVSLVAANQEIAYDFTIPIWDANYQNDIYLWVDSLNQISELSEGNNVSLPMFFSASSDVPNEIEIGFGYYPVIYGNKIIWSDWRNGNSDIYMYDLDTQQETRITTDLASQGGPAIYGNKIVWSDNRNGNSDIYMFDLDTQQETRITTDLASQGGPAIYGNKIVWEDYRNGYSDIYMYDLNTQQETRITTDPNRQSNPAIYGSKIVWEDYRNILSDIYMYDLDTQQETRITIDPGIQEYPAIYGNKIVWQDYRNGNWDIYMYDLGADGRFGTGDLGEGEYRVTTNSSSQMYPAIYGNKIVWSDWRNSLPDIYMFDLDTQQEVRLTFNTPITSRNNPSIYGRKVVYQGYKNGAYRIFMVDLNQPPALNSIGNKEALVGQALTFLVSASDADGDLLQFSATNRPPDASFVDNGNGSATFSWTPLAAGAYQGIHFEVSDGNGGKDSEDISITVNNPPPPNRSPVLNPIGNKEINEGQLLAFTVTATDPDGDPLVFSASNLPAGANFADNHDNTATFSWTPNYSQAGIYANVHFEVTDGVAVAAENITITVKRRIKGGKFIEQK